MFVTAKHHHTSCVLTILLFGILRIYFQQCINGTLINLLSCHVYCFEIESNVFDRHFLTKAISIGLCTLKPPGNASQTHHQQVWKAAPW
jgi:hypothetical protein